MQRFFYLGLLALCSLPLLAQPRTIVTTDGEIDDVDSFIRMLLYANEFKLEGLVYSSSMWHYKGDGKGTTMVSEMDMTRRIYGERSELRWVGEQWMQDLISEYAKVYPQLSQHASGYPTADQLLSLVRVGNIQFEGEMDQDTEGSDLIKARLLDPNPEPLYLQVWGGTNTIARALKSIEEEYSIQPGWPALKARVSEKAIIYAILDQDATYRKYIAPNWPDVRVYYNAAQFWCLAYFWPVAVPSALHPWLKGTFMGENIINDHGPLLRKYYSYGDGQQQPGDPEHTHGDSTKTEHPQWGPYDQYDFISEGDSPAFLHLIDVGLGNLEHPEYGGWGGRLAPSGAVASRWEDGPAVAEYNPFTERMDTAFAQTRWLKELQLDFAARADWCVKPYGAANHPPVVRLKGKSTRLVVPGQRIRLRAKVSDPDGDVLSVNWWRYAGPGSFGPADAADELLDAAVYYVPETLQPGETIHLICSVSDGGTPALTRYGRLVLVGK